MHADCGLLLLLSLVLMAAAVTSTAKFVDSTSSAGVADRSNCTAAAAAVQEPLDLLVIGAGISGLVCATEAQAAGLRVAVVEARERVGGRLLSFRGADLGASWCWPVEWWANRVFVCLALLPRSSL